MNASEQDRYNLLSAKLSQMTLSDLKAFKKLHAKASKKTLSEASKEDSDGLKVEARQVKDIINKTLDSKYSDLLFKK